MPYQVFNFQLEASDGSPYWTFGASGSPVWRDRKTLNTAITLPAEKSITDAIVTATSGGVKVMPAVTGTVTAANQWHKNPALNKWTIDNSVSNLTGDYILKWNVSGDPMANNDEMFTAIIAQSEGAGNQSNHHLGVLLKKHLYLGSTIYSAQVFRSYGDDNDNGGGHSTQPQTEQTFDRAAIGLTSGHYLRLKVRRRVSGANSYVRFWLYYIGATLPAPDSGSDYTDAWSGWSAGSVIARHGANDTDEYVWGMISPRDFGFQNCTGADIELALLKVESYAEPSMIVDSSFPATQNVAKNTDDWYYLRLNLARGGDTSTFNASFIATPTGVTAEVVSDFLATDYCMIRFKAGASATVADGQTFTIRASNGLVNVDYSPTFNIKAAPGSGGALAYLTGDQGDVIAYGSSSIYQGKTAINTTRGTRLGGTGAWTGPALTADEAGGMFGAVGSTVTGTWTAGNTNGLLARLMSYAHSTGVRHGIGVVPASNDNGQSVATVRAATKTFLKYMNDMGIDMVGQDIGFRGAAVAVGSTTSGGTSANQVLIDLAAVGNTCSSSTGAYNTNFYVGVTYGSGVQEVRRCNTYTVSGNTATCAMSESYVNQPSGVRAVQIIPSTAFDKILQFNAMLVELATPGHADNYVNATFGTTYRHKTGYAEASKMSYGNSDGIHPGDYQPLADNVIDAESAYFLEFADVSVTPSTADLLPLATQDFNFSISGASYFGASLFPANLTPGAFALASGSGSVNSSSGLYTAPASPTTAVVRYAFTYNALSYGEATANVQAPFNAGTISTTARTSASITLSIPAPTEGTAPYSYVLHRGTSPAFVPGGGNIVTSGAISSTISYENTGLTAATTYYYKVVYTDNGSLTATSNEVSLATFATLTSGTASLVSKTATTVQVTCTAPSGGNTPYTYQWHRSTSPGFVAGGGNAVGSATSLTLNDSGRTASTHYYYKMVATDFVSGTVTSNEIDALTEPPPSVGMPAAIIKYS